jgi:hypothetical protein
MNIRIGSPNWLSELKRATKTLGDDFWSRFTPVSEAGLDNIEAQIGRNLPDDFREFYKSVGFGTFEPGIGLYSPNDIISCIGAPIYFVLGSLTPGQEWATADEHRNLWLSRGTDNPSSARFTGESLTLNGVKLYDLLQFGIDGSGCYYQLYVGPDPAPFRYCLLTDSSTIEEKSASLSSVLERIFEEHISNLHK